MNDNPYAAPDHGIDRHRAEERLGSGDDVIYMGFWKRVLASILDNILLGIACIPVALLIHSTIRQEQTADLVYNLISMVVTVTAILLFWKFKQATPGKMVFGGRIVDAETYGKPAFGKLVLRYIGYIPSTLVLGLGFLWVAFDKRKRGWHDLMAGTLVVTSRPLGDRRRTRPLRRPVPAGGGDGRSQDLPPAAR
jgi:uncharacterized RDD family membrane protein YckC